MKAIQKLCGPNFPIIQGYSMLMSYASESSVVENDYTVPPKKILKFSTEDVDIRTKGKLTTDSHFGTQSLQQLASNV